MTNLSRRGILGALIAAPAIVRVESLMRLPKPWPIIRPLYGIGPATYALEDLRDLQRQLRAALIGKIVNPPLVVHYVAPGVPYYRAMPINVRDAQELIKALA